MKIYDKIGEQVRLLRSIPPPNPSYYGRINYQGYHPYDMIIGPTRDLVGPFNTYKAFLDHLYNNFESNLAGKLTRDGSEIKATHQLFSSNFFDCFDESSKSGEPKLSHMDLKLENMIFVPSASNPSNRVEDYDVWIIDWEYLCWYPAWAEAAAARQQLPRHHTDECVEAEWGVSRGIKPFYSAQARFFGECRFAFGGTFC